MKKMRKSLVVTIILLLSIMLFACNKTPQNITPPNEDDDNNNTTHEYENLLNDLTDTIWVSGESILLFKDSARATLYCFSDGAYISCEDNFLNAKFDKTIGYAGVASYTANSFFVKNPAFSHEFLRATNIVIKPMIATILPNKSVNTFCAIKDGAMWLGAVRDGLYTYNNFLYFDDALAKTSTLAGDIIFAYPKDIKQFSATFLNEDITLMQMQLHNYLNDDWYYENCQLPILANTSTKEFIGWGDKTNIFKDTTSLITYLSATKSDCIFRPLYNYKDILSPLDSTFWQSGETFLSFNNTNSATLYNFSNGIFVSEENNFVNVSFSTTDGYTNIVPTSSDSFTLQMNNISYEFNRANNILLKPLVVTSTRDQFINSFCVLKNNAIWLHGIQDGEKSYKYYSDLLASDSTLNGDTLYAYPNNLTLFSATFKDGEQTYCKVNLHNYLPSSWYDENIKIPSIASTPTKKYNGWKIGETIIAANNITNYIKNLNNNCIFKANFSYIDVLTPFNSDLWVAGEKILRFNDGQKADLYIFTDMAFSSETINFVDFTFDAKNGYSGVSSYTESTFTININSNLTEFSRVKNVSIKPMQTTISRDKTISSYCALKNNAMWMGNAKYDNITYDNLKYFSDILATDMTLVGETIYAYPQNIATYNLHYLDNGATISSQILHQYLSDTWLSQNIKLHVNLPPKDDMAFCGWKVGQTDIANSESIIAIIKDNNSCADINIIANYKKINPYLGSYYGVIYTYTEEKELEYTVQMVINDDSITFTSKLNGVNTGASISCNEFVLNSANISITYASIEIDLVVVNNDFQVSNCALFQLLKIENTTELDTLELVKK